MKPTTLRVLWMPLAAALVTSTPAAAQTISLRWSSPSRLTPDQASDVFFRQADGQPVVASDLFEAQKYLRTDGTVSLGGAVMKEAARKLTAARLAAAGDFTVRIRALAPILQWADSTTFIDTTGAQVVRVRGETVAPVVLNEDPNLAATELFHWTVYNDWRVCGSTVCYTSVASSVRTNISYELGVPLQSSAPGEAHSSELILATGFTGQVYTQTHSSTDTSRYVGVACDPLPSNTTFTPDSVSPSMILFTHNAQRTEHQKTNQVFGAFFAQPSDQQSRLTYRIGTGVARPPSTGSKSATINNPLYFRMYE